MSCWRPLALLLGIALASAGCGQADGSPGSLMLAISTDMYVDKDLSQVDIIVQPESGPTQSAQISLFPGLEGQFLPGTFSITEGNEPGEFVRIRVIARQGDLVRVVREAALKIPRRRTALLSMPIQWLCDGHVRQEGQLHRSDCPEDYTCISGSCQPDAVDEASLPDYAASEVFGGGNATGGGRCFDTVACFSGAIEPGIDLGSCRLDIVPSDDLNVGVVLPPGGDGHCTGTECWIPLDRSPLTGWSEAEGKVQLPGAVCERVAAGGARILASTGCESKLPDTPTCGPWTLVGTEPGAGQPIDPGRLPGGVSNRELMTELREVTDRFALEVLASCSNVAGMSLAGEATVPAIEDACAQAESVLRPLGSLLWHHIPTRCWPDAERRLSCERTCNPQCEPGEVVERCTMGLVGTCDGVCSSGVCIGSEGSPAECAGACQGLCAGSCGGTCLGECVGTCSGALTSGACDGFCDGTCKGLCEGPCEGTCAGTCARDPSAGPIACSAGTSCLGGCEGAIESATCDGFFSFSSCQIETGCEADCEVLAQFGIECDRPSMWIADGEGIDEALRVTIESALPELIAIRDRKSTRVLDEARRLLSRMGSDPNAAAEDLAQVQADIDLLAALVANATEVVALIGPERFGPVGGAPPATTCEVVRASGNAPRIDDFEDGDGWVLNNDGRDGAWHISRDLTGTLLTSEPPLPEAGGANGSALAMHVAGSGFTEWGAALGLELRSGAAPYDASIHEGLRFWARGNNRVVLTFLQANLDQGHACATCALASGGCGAFYSTEIFLSSSWSQIVIPWSSLQRDIADGVGFAPDQLLAVEFHAPAPEAFDFWVDDVEFY